MSLIVEVLSSALGASRRDLQDLLDSAGTRLASAQSQIERRLGSAVGQSDDAAQGADEVLAVAAEFSDPGLNRQIAKLLVSAGGVGWGVSVVSAAVNTGGAAVAVGLGITLEPVIALVLGLLILAVSGVFAYRVVKELWRRLETQSEALMNA